MSSPTYIPKADTLRIEQSNKPDHTYCKIGSHYTWADEEPQPFVSVSVYACLPSMGKVDDATDKANNLAFAQRIVKALAVLDAIEAANLQPETR